METSSTAPVAEDVAGKQTETALTRISLMISTITSVTTLLISVASDVVSTPWLLSSATVISLVCLAVLFVTIRPLENERKKRLFSATAAASVLVLSVAWLFVYRDEIRFSGFAAHFFTKAPVLVDDGVADRVVSSKVGGISRERRLIAVVDALVEEPHHSRVVAGATPETKGALLHLGGAVAETRFSLSLSAPDSDAKASLDLAKVQGLSSAPQLLAAIAGDDYFLGSSFDEGPLAVTIAGSPQTLKELLALAYRAVGGARAAREGNGALANAHFAQFSQICEVLGDDTARTVEWLPDAFLFASRRLLAAGNAQAASTFIERGLKLRADDARLRIAAEYLRFRRGDAIGTSPAQPSDSKLESSEIALQETLRGISDLKTGAAWDAIRHFEAAADNANTLPPSHRFALHMAAALLLSDVEADPNDRAARLLRQTAAADAILPNVPMVGLLTGFGHALAGNSRKAEQAFDEVRESAKGNDVRRECDYWRALAAYTLKDRAAALKLLQELEHSDPMDARVLGLLAELSAGALFDDDTSNKPAGDAIQNALALANRALKQDPDEARSRRVVGTYKATEAAKNRGPLRTTLLQEALEHLQVARRRGRDDSYLYEQISWIERELAQADDSKLAARQADEVACHRERRMESCSVLEVRALLERNDIDGATDRTNNFIRALRRSAISDERGNNLIVNLAVAWYEANRVDEAQALYGIVRKNMAHSAANSQSLTSLVDCNEGFILVDSGKSREAAQLFRRGLGTQPSADCEAGLAIALFDAGDSAEALLRYQSARQQDDNYDNVDVLRRDYFWSPRACSLVGELRTMKGTASR